MKENGMPYWARSEKPSFETRQMRRLALQELTVKRGSPKLRARRSLRIILPAWLSGRTTQASEQMEKDIK